MIFTIRSRRFLGKGIEEAVPGIDIMIWEIDMAVLTQQERQVVEQFRQLEPLRRRYVLLEMARTDADGWKQFQKQGESRLRELAAQKGLDWNQLDDQQRQNFVEEFLDGDGQIRRGPRRLR